MCGVARQPSGLIFTSCNILQKIIRNYNELTFGCDIIMPKRKENGAQLGGEARASLDSSSAERVLKSIFRLTGCGLMMLSQDGEITCNIGSCGCNCPESRKKCSGSQAPKDAGNEESICQDCITAHLHAAYQAERFGGKYIYFCPSGLVFCIAEVLGEPKSRFLVAGPIMATDRENYIPDDLGEPFSADAQPSEEMRRYTSSLKYLPASDITCLSDLIFMAANHISGYDYRKLFSREEQAKQQEEINDYIQSVKSRMLLGAGSVEPYPYDKEKQLKWAIMTGEEADARRLLNEILGHIFFASAYDLDSIKIRAMELAVVISRAALDGGAEASSVYILNPKYIRDFFALDTIEDICFALSKMLHRFTEETFNLSKVKHVDLLSRAISYIRANYMHKITLEDVAGHVMLSPSYLSKLFREELGMTFNSFLTSVRIERSRMLLLSDQLTIAQIAEYSGFFDQSYFNKVFKRVTGLTPKKYRELRGGISGAT